MAKPTKFILHQNEEGKWVCTTPQIKMGYYLADSPSEAIKGCQIALADLQNFVDHNYGRCDQNICDRCKREPETRGRLSVLVDRVAERFRSTGSVVRSDQQEKEYPKDVTSPVPDQQRGEAKSTTQCRDQKRSGPKKRKS